MHALEIHRTWMNQNGQWRHKRIDGKRVLWGISCAMTAKCNSSAAMSKWLACNCCVLSANCVCAWSYNLCGVMFNGIGAWQFCGLRRDVWYGTNRFGFVFQCIAWIGSASSSMNSIHANIEKTSQWYATRQNYSLIIKNYAELEQKTLQSDIDWTPCSAEWQLISSSNRSHFTLAETIDFFFLKYWCATTIQAQTQWNAVILQIQYHTIRVIYIKFSSLLTRSGFVQYWSWLTLVWTATAQERPHGKPSLPE